MAQKRESGKLVAENRKARFNFAIEDTLEAGLVLTGSEVKSLRAGKANIGDAYASDEGGGALYLINAHIAGLRAGQVLGHEERRRGASSSLTKRQLARLWQGIGREGMTLVPLKLYFNEKGRAKLQLGIAKGKKLSDKRDTEKKRDWEPGRRAA